MRIAIIGAGVSGLSAAYWLRERHQVTLFEQATYLGGHAHTVDVEIGGERQAIDTGFIVFNDRTYPRFVALLNELGVASQATTMGFSVRCDQSDLEYNGTSLAGLFTQRKNLLRPGFYRMLADIVRFNRAAPALLKRNHDRPDSDQITVGDFLNVAGYSRSFAEHYLLPLGSAIWSCPRETFEKFPLRFILEFFQNHGLLNLRDRPTWRTVCGGSRRYVEAIASKLAGRIRLRTSVAAVRRFSDRVEIICQGVPAETFDHVIFACHADQALRMLADPTPLERDVVGAFPYERNTAVLHTDTALLPRRKRAWASWNYRIGPDRQAPATVTYCMNILQRLTSQHVFNVTLNGDHQINPQKILGHFVYEHPVFTTRRAAAQARHNELIGVNRSSFCGAYWRNGFHEDGVHSALAVCRALAHFSELRYADDRTCGLQPEPAPLAQ
jgi:predicted NAD/FAD-binding protein